MNQKLSTKTLILSALLGVLTYIGSLISIPFGPVPFTLQTLVVILAGLLLTPVAAGLSQIVHLVLKVMLTGGATLASPAFGFVVGFIFAATFISIIRLRYSSTKGYIASALVGEIILYGVGIPYMAYVLLTVKGLSMTPMAILQAGLFPFILTDIVKAGVAIFIAKRLEKFQQN